MEKKTNLWILTEERPKPNVITNIVYKFAKDKSIPCFIDTIRILPILEKDRKFTFLYEIIGFKSNKINKIFLKIISGSSSFVDFLIFYQDNAPQKNDIPIYGIEETKTDDSESRNTGVYQRASKFVYINHYYKNIKKIMYYNLQIAQKSTPTQTYIFGTRCLLTIGVEIFGKDLNPNIFKPFKSIDELIHFKKNMRRAPAGNIPILITKEKTKIIISGRLFKSTGLSHDPNIGALSLISATLRKLGWKNEIIVTKHGLEQIHLKPRNKFIKIANIIDIQLDGLSIPKSINSDDYWHYEKKGEKLGTIFIHLVVENFTKGYSVFENHAGCEKGYFLTKEGEHIPLKKYSDKKAYKAGNKKKIISIPDLIIIDFTRSEIINIEGKKYQFKQNGIEELDNFSDIESIYIKKYYPKFKIIRTVVLYGGTKKVVIEVEVGFLLNEKGDLVLGIKAPKIFREAIKNLLDFWS